MTTQIPMNGHGLKEFFIDLRSDYFTGEVIVHCNEGRKSVFIQNGEITHCSSNSLDDRLGDVIYREGKISLELLVELAGKVDRTNRFGDLLIQSGTLSTHELWEALILQSIEILRSLVFQGQVELELIPANILKTPDFGLRFRWDKTMEEALEELRDIRRFERIARQSPTLSIDDNYRMLASNDFLKEMVSLIEEFPDFNLILDEKSQLSKTYTLRALFRMYSLGIISDSWNLFSQVLTKPADDALKSAVDAANKVFTSMESLVIRRQVPGWNESMKSAVRILETEFGPGISLIPNLGFSLQQLRKTLAFNPNFKSSAKEALAHRWRSPLVTLIQEGMQKALLYLLFELSNNRQMEEEVKAIHVELVSSRDTYFSRVAEAIS